MAHEKISEDTLTHKGELDYRRKAAVRQFNPKGKANVVYDMKTPISDTKDIMEIMGKIIAFNRPLRFDHDYEKHTNSISEFLSEFFKLNNKYNTIYADDDTLQCPAKTIRRSLIDIFLITRFYFPNTTLKSVIKNLYIHHEKTINIQFCQMIRRRVYDGRQGKGAFVYNGEAKDELGFTVDEYLKIAGRK